MYKLFVFITIPFMLFSKAYAHHGTSGQFDLSTRFEVGGVVTDVGFVNPHSYVYFDVTDENGQVVNWHCEMRGAAVLRRSGWTEEMFTNGTRIDILASPSRKEPTGCYVETISFNGGSEIQRYQQLEENKPEINTDRSLRTDWNTPYIGGDWAAVQHLPDPGDVVPNFARFRSVRIKMTAAGIEAAKAMQNAPDDAITGRLDCTPRDVLNDWIYNQSPNKVTQTEEKITLQLGFMDVVKVVHMDMAEHPANIEPAWIGHSIGQWDGDVLVVDTVGYTQARGRGNIHSEQLHTVERFTLDSENGALHRSFVADDALFWEELLTGEDMVYLSDIPYEPYNCDDRAVE